MIMPEWILWGGLAGTLIALLCGPLGACMLWQRLSYFGDTLAHAALLGVGIAVMCELPNLYAIFGVCLGLAVVLRLLERQHQVSQDALLSLLSNTVLAVGIILISRSTHARLNVQGLLFGDILAVDIKQVGFIFLWGVFSALCLWRIWRPLVSVVVFRPLAELEGIRAERILLFYALLLGSVIALGVQVIGVLLMSALLVIPASAARFISDSPQGMALKASLIGVLSVWGGMALSVWQDWPTGPSIVVMASVIFVGLRLLLVITPKFH